MNEVKTAKRSKTIEVVVQVLDFYGIKYEQEHIKLLKTVIREKEIKLKRPAITRREIAACITAAKEWKSYLTEDEDIIKIVIYQIAQIVQRGSSAIWAEKLKDFEMLHISNVPGIHLNEELLNKNNWFKTFIIDGTPMKAREGGARIPC